MDIYKKHLNHAIAKVDHLMERFSLDFPSASTTDLVYGHKENKEWTAGFFSGMVWLAYEVTGADKYREFGQRHTVSFRRRLDEKRSIDFHDLGFLYTLSCVADYKLTGSALARETALLAADHLAGRFQEMGGFIQAWSSLDDPEEYRLIIDCFLNLPLLFWAAAETGDRHYADIARKHYDTAVNTVIRPDFTTFHTFFFDRETGKPLRGATNQGYSDDSCWARGQAWAIYGIVLFLKYCPLESCRELNRLEQVLKVFAGHLPEDQIPVWDFAAKEDIRQKDSSAAAIVICGLQAYEQGVVVRREQAEMARALKYSMLSELMTHYDTINEQQDDQMDGLLLHGVHHWPRKQGVDESNLWGDYFYMEALVRECHSWHSYW